MARQHGTRQPAPGHRDGDDHRRGAIRRLARVTAMATITAPLSSRAAAADRSRRRQPQVASMGQSDPLPRTPHGQGSVSRQRFGVNPPGLGNIKGATREMIAWSVTIRPEETIEYFEQPDSGPGQGPSERVVERRLEGPVVEGRRRGINAHRSSRSGRIALCAGSWKPISSDSRREARGRSGLKMFTAVVSRPCPNQATGIDVR